MRHHLFIATAILALAALLPSEARAQVSGRTGGSSSLFGNRSLGSTLSGANRSFGGTGRGGMQAGTPGQITGNERFLRGNRQPGDFIGRDAATTKAFFDSITGGRGNAGRGDSGQRNFRNNNQNRDRQPALDRGQNRIQVRPRLRAAFAHPPLQTGLVSARLQQRLRRVLLARSGTLSEVVLQDGTAILRGVVANPHDRLVAEKLAYLEPGILEVRNELRVMSLAQDQRSAEEAASEAQR